MQINPDKLKQIVRMIAKTREDEIGCEKCYAEMDRFVELLIEGKKPEEAMPLVQHHLEMCGDCNEEFKALFEALQVKT